MANLTVAAARRLFLPESVRTQRAGPRERFFASPDDHRLNLLNDREVIAALGAELADQLRRELQRRLRRLEAKACSWTWLRASWNHHEAFPPPGMVLSRAMTQFTTIGRSDEATPSRRFMPAIAVDLEDMLDLKSESQALRYVHPPSPSACALQQIHMRFAWSRSERRKGLAASRPRARKSGRALTGEFHARPDGSYGVAYV